jgi:hypothetical protein
LPGPKGEGTFPILPLEPADPPPGPATRPPVTPDGPGMGVQPQRLDCGTARVGAIAACGQGITVTSSGDQALEITSLQVIGSAATDFTAKHNCPGSLSARQSCAVTVGFRPTGSGRRNATLIIHQNLPAPNTGTRIALSGTAETEPTAHLQVQVQMSGPLVGSVQSVPPGINCPGTCSAAFPAETAVTLHARFLQRAGSVRWVGCAPTERNACVIKLPPAPPGRAGVIAQLSDAPTLPPQKLAPPNSAN